VLLVAGSHTAQAFITTDLDDNQISAFHPGAMEHSSRNRIPEDAGIGLALVGPEGREGMLTHARTLSERGIPFLFDPGQAMPLFSSEELLWFVDRAKYVADERLRSQAVRRPDRTRSGRRFAAVSRRS
jgi:adenosine kinase